MAQRTFVTHPIITRRLTVLRIADLNERMRRVTLTGPQLFAFSRDGLDLPAFVSTGFDDHVKLVFANNGDIASVLPVQYAHSIDWTDAPNREMRDYTPRRFDAETGELDLDFVRHGDGPAANWAETAVIGSTLHIVGPKSSLVIPANVDWLLLAGDETALPAIGRYLDERTDDRPVQVVIELGHPAARQHLPLRESDTLRWVDTRPGALIDAIQATEWWSGTAYVWAAAESGSLLPLRRWLTRDRGLLKTHINVTGYWHDPNEADADGRSAEGPTSAIDVDALLSPMPWFAARSALTLGVLDAIADQPRPAGRLASDLELESRSLGALVDYLVQVEVFALDGELVSLGRVGVALLGDEHLRESLEDGLESRMLSALTQLSPALAAHESGFERTHGHTLLAEVQNDPARFEELLDENVGVNFIIEGASVLPPLTESPIVAVTGVGSAAFATSIPHAVLLTVVEASAALTVLRRSIDRPGTVFAEELPTADLAVAVAALSYRTDAEATALFRELAASANRALVIEHLEPHNLDSLHEAEHALVTLAATGAPAREQDDVVARATEAGWRLETVTALGWGYWAIEFTRGQG